MNSTGAPNLLDAVLVLLLFLAVFRGWRQGALSQLTAFAGLALGLLAGMWLAPRVADAIVDGPGAALLTLGLLLVAGLVGQGVGIAVGLRLRRGADRVGVGPVDRVAGIGVGVAITLFVVWLLAGALVQGPSAAISQQIRGSAVVDVLDRALPSPPDVVGSVAAHLDRQGFPQVFADLGGGVTAAPVPETADASVRAAAAAGQPSTVMVRGVGCGGRIGTGSGFVTRPGVVVTNAHVVAGFERLTVQDTDGTHPAVAIGVDPDLDLAVLAVPDTEAPPIAWADTALSRGTEGAVLGFPGGRTDLVVEPATVRTRIDAVGRDIYGEDQVRREVLVLASSVERGNSGGPFVTADGRVGGVVFAGDAAGGDTAYALTPDEVRPVVEDAVARDEEAPVGACRP
ncbi:MarP family serine protease [Actinomycetospora cinnamomea]|uniref:Colicin V production protein n=1 Tax=Actinomycetospora cinnamomea TaxID=663609 RepID=A0A2U1FCZ3_9PSEU|nr:MarP family serine protease [Actinomycetospora cinnamomea]PVZ10024.1 colicin V production protein [Actinomycetospora cinnamomea]